MQKNQPKKRLAIIGGIVAAALVLGGGATWGVIAYQDAQVTNEAQAHASAVQEVHELAASALASHLSEIDQARATLEAVQPSADMLQTRAELFHDETLESFVLAVAELTEQTNSPAASEVPIDIATGDAFIAQFRAADAAERTRLAQASSTTASQLEELAANLESANVDLRETVAASQRAAVAVMQDLPTRAESVVADHPEADETAVLAINETVSNGQWDAVTDANLADHVAALQDYLIVYIESADRVKESHEQAVKQREAEEAAEAERIAAEAAAAAAAAAANQNTGGGGGGGGGGYEVPLMCNVWEPDFFSGGSTLVLKPC